MELRWLSSFITIALLMFIIVLVSSQQEVKMQQNTHFICGDDFIDLWRKICTVKDKMTRRKRSIAAFVKLDTDANIIDRRRANQFLGLKRRRRWIVKKDLMNANEECCNEACAYEEISEYCNI